MGYFNTRSIGLIIVVIIILIIAIYWFRQKFPSDEERYANKGKLITGVAVTTLVAIVAYYVIDNAHHQKHHHHHGKHHSHKDGDHHHHKHELSVSVATSPASNGRPPRVNPTIL